MEAENAKVIAPHCEEPPHGAFVLAMLTFRWEIEATMETPSDRDATASHA